MMYEVEFRFNSVDRTRMMSFIPRMGDVIDLLEDEDSIVLRVEKTVAIERDGSWKFHCNCVVQDNWIK